nr:ATP-binding protein [Streptomyces sp. DSM 41633]
FTRYAQAPQTARLLPHPPLPGVRESRRTPLAALV